MPSWVTGQPFAIAVIILFAIVLLRAQATYWVARAVAGGVLRSRWSERLTTPKVTRAVEVINRWGPPVVTVSFLTVGFQTVVNAAAGLTRMPFIRYLLAMLPGCVAWAFIYAAVFEGAVYLAQELPWVLVGVAVVVLVVTAVLVIRRRRRGTTSLTAQAEPVTDEA